MQDILYFSKQKMNNFAVLYREIVRNCAMQKQLFSPNCFMGSEKFNFSLDVQKQTTGFIKTFLLERFRLRFFGSLAFAYKVFDVVWSVILLKQLK